MISTFSVSYTHLYDVIAVERSEITIAEVESLQLLAPFGEGFEEPLFLLEKQKVQDCRSLSKGAHTKWILSDDLEAMQFQSRDWEFYNPEAVSYTHLAENDTLHNMPFEVTPATVCDAILAADAYGHYFLGI